MGLLALAVMVLLNRICSFFHLSIIPLVCPGAFLELDYYFFVNFGMVLETHVKLYMTARVFGKNLFFLRNREKGQFVL